MTLATPIEPFQVELAQRLVAYLERLSVDSAYAHQASGVKGALLRQLEQNEKQSKELIGLIEKGFEVLEKAAAEIQAGDTQNPRKRP